MKYQCKVEINASRDKVTELYQDITWQKELGLARKEIIKGEPWQTGSEAYLYFPVNEKELVMKETIEANNLPQSLTVIYEMGDTWNRCVNQFIEKNGKVIYIMDVEFRFKEELDIPKIKFINQTQQEMVYFKSFVERNP
ncbi:MAG: hypothetical protein GX490_04875 [Bacilli bacterium]|nr:hypothetical protein [Bacilli bacterium]